jgi:hypothetical protein
MILIRDFEEMYENPKPPPKWDVQDPAKLQEQFDDYLHYTNGELNLPLAYVMHEQVELMPANENLLTHYTTAREEMIAHAPHGTNKHSSCYCWWHYQDSAWACHCHLSSVCLCWIW